MDIRTIPVSQFVDLNRASHGQLHPCLAAAWDIHGAQAIDIQVSHTKAGYAIHVTGLVGDGVVFERVIQVTATQTLTEAQRIVLLLLWVSTIQARVARALARGDAAVARFLNRKPAG